jgi:hypothetical protein
LGFGPNALPDLQRTLKHAVEHRTRAAMIHSDPIRLAYLAKNFGFAQHHGVQARCNPKEVPYRLSIVAAIEAAIQDLGFNFVEGCQEEFHRPSTVVGR